MKPYIFTTLIFLLFGSFRNIDTNIQNIAKVGDLKFIISGLTPGHGWVRAVLYNNPDQFLSQFGFCFADSALVKEDGTAIVVIHNLPYGRYAGSFYQDENQNFVIDRNLIGLPTEPYAFSNSIRAKWKIPDYHKVTFNFQQPTLSQTIVLNYWSNQ